MYLGPWGGVCTPSEHEVNCEEEDKEHIGSIHRLFIYTGDTSTHAQGTDPRVALGA